QEQCRQQLTRIAEELETLRPLALAKQHRRWWTPAYWKASSAKVARFTELEATEKNLQTKEQQLSEQRVALLPATGETENPHAAERTGTGESAAAEIELWQQQKLAQQTTAKELLAAWEQAPFRPAAVTREALRQGRAVWEKQTAQEKEKAKFLDRW